MYYIVFLVVLMFLVTHIGGAGELPPGAKYIWAPLLV